MKAFVIGLLSLGTFPLTAAADVTKEDIKKLSNASLSDEVIVNYIRRNRPAAELSAEELIELKRANVSDVVLKAFVEAGASAQEPSESVPRKPVEAERKAQPSGPIESNSKPTHYRTTYGSYHPTYRSSYSYPFSRYRSYGYGYRPYGYGYRSYRYGYRYCR